MELRDYQQQFRDSILQAMWDGYNSVLAVLPTGGGKRYSIVDLCLLAMQHNRRVLVATNRRLLVDQMVKECRDHNVDFGVIMADYFEGDPSAPIQIASIQTIQSWYMKPRFSSEEKGVGLPHWDLLLIDEGHSQTSSYDELREFRPEAKTLAFTATPLGSEGRSLVPSSFSRMVEGATNSQLIASGHLLPTRVFAPSEPNIEGVKIVKGQEYNQNQLGRAVQSCTVFSDVYSEWERHAANRATVAFVPGVAFGRDLVRQFNFLMGPGTAHLIEAKTKHAEREAAFEAIRAGTSKILVSVGVLVEGFDLTKIKCILDLQPSTQFRNYWQKLGRAKRPFEDWPDALYLDFAGNSWRFTHPNDNPIWPTGDETTQEAIQKARKEGKQAAPIICPKCHFVREKGPVCPSCGHKGSDSIRRVRMGNGRLVEVKAEFKQKVEKSESEKLFAKWQQRLFGALKSGISYAQCAEIFRRETGKYPLPHWVGVFPKDSVQAKQHPKRHFTPGQLAMACRKSPK